VGVEVIIQFVLLYKVYDVVTKHYRRI